MGAGDRVKQFGRTDQPRPLVDRADSPCEQLLSRRSCSAFSGGYSLAEPQPLALSSSVSAHAERNAHGGVRSPCAFRCASSDEQRGDLGLCQTSDASAAIKPVSRHRKKGYAVDVLLIGPLTDIFEPNRTGMCNIPAWRGAFRECGRQPRCSHTHAVHQKISCQHPNVFEHVGVSHRHTRARRQNVQTAAPTRFPRRPNVRV